MCCGSYNDERFTKYYTVFIFKKCLSEIYFLGEQYLPSHKGTIRRQRRSRVTALSESFKPRYLSCKIDENDPNDNDEIGYHENIITVV